MKNITRVDWIDRAKGIGIWLVVVGHILTGRAEAAAAENIIWAFHMPLFFYLSGLTAKSTDRINYVNDVKKSIKSIVVPYLVFSFISIALYTIEKSVNLLVLVNQLLEMSYGVSGNERWMSYNVPLWFFTCLFCVRVIFLSLSVWLKKSSDIMVVTIVLACTVHALFVFSIPRLPWNVDVALCALVFYSAGHAWGSRAFISESKPWMMRLFFYLIFAAILYIVSIVNGRVDMNGRYFNNPVLFYIGAFSGIIVVAFIAQSLSKFNWLIAVGVASVVIFPMHGLLHYFLPERTLSILSWYTYRVIGSATGAAMVFGAIEVAFCMPFFWVFTRYAPVLIGRGRSSGIHST